MTDSRQWPMRWGVTATALAHCGFKQLNDMRGEKDLFGRKIVMV
jgi:F420-0:gamma-glutamyl ligase